MGGVRRSIAVGIAVSLFGMLPSLPAQAEDLLQQARVAVQANDLTNASLLYQQITPESDQYEQKLADAIRIHLAKAKYTEAWRVIEIAKRIDADVPQLEYLRALAITLSGSCALGLSRGDSAWYHLISAHVARFRSDFDGGVVVGGQAFSQYAKRRAMLDVHRSHYLNQIPKAQLIRGQGCRYSRWLWSDNDEGARKDELASLGRFLDESAEESLEGKQAVMMRYLELAAADLRESLSENDQVETESLVDDLKDKRAAEILTRYGKLRSLDWLALPEPERRFLWQVMIDFRVFPKDKVPASDIHADLVYDIILGSNDAQAARWLGLVNVDTFPRDKQKALWTHLSTLRQLPARSQVLVRKAWRHYEDGEWNDVLGLLRLMLVQGEANEDANARDGAMRIAALMFTEFRYDDAMLGALQATVPGRYWEQILTQILVDQAIAGDGPGFERVVKVLQESFGKARLLRKAAGAELALYRSMAQRSGSRFNQTLEKIWRKGRGRQKLKSLAGQLAASVVVAEQSIQQAAYQFLGPLRDKMKVAMADGRDQETWLALIIALSGEEAEAGDRWRQGVDAARRQTVRIGLVDLSKGVSFAQPWQWDSPRTLPLRKLLVRPVAPAGESWVIQ